MTVTVKLYGNLRKYLKRNEEFITLVLAEGSRVRDAIHAVDMQEGEAWMVTVNKEVVGEEGALHEGDEVRMFSAVMGGTKLTP